MVTSRVSLAEGTCITVSSIAALALLFSARWRRKFAPMLKDPPAATLAAIARDRLMPLRHKVIQGAISPEKLERAFDAIRKAFNPQQVDYNNSAYGKNHWNLSCFMQYTNGVAREGVNLSKGEPLLHVCTDLLDECDAIFLKWYQIAHPSKRGSKQKLHRLQSFVTRYTPQPEETHLPRHIDGANVDGSLVLGLPTYSGFKGGGLTVWDGDNESEIFEYPVASGDMCLLDSRVWHQSNPIFSGERWVIVIFYELEKEKADSVSSSRWAVRGGDKSGSSRSRAIRELLAERMVQAAKRKAFSTTTDSEQNTSDAAMWKENS